MISHIVRLMFLVAFAFMCSGGCSNTSRDNSKTITAYSLLIPAATGIIDDSAKTISLAVPYGTDITALIAAFQTTGASVTVGPAVQISGTTRNDFSNPVQYTVTAEDGSSVNYTVTVAVASSSVKTGKMLRVTVMDYLHNNLPNVTVVLGDENGAMKASGVTDGNGQFDFTDAPENATVTAATTTLLSGGTSTTKYLEIRYDVNTDITISFMKLMARRRGGSTIPSLGHVTLNVTNSSIAA